MSSQPPAVAPTAGLGRASALLASGTIVSRILGFVSGVVLTQTLGLQGAGSNTFSLANQLPNNVYAIVAGGLISAVLVPQIVRAGMHDDGGQRFINRVVTLGGVIFIGVTLVATLCAPLLVNLYAQHASAPGRGFSSADFALATAFAYWCLPQILFYALYSLLGEVLNARGRFGAFTWAPVLNNVVAIAGLVTFRVIFGSSAVADAGSWTPSMISLLAGSATLGVATQAFVLVLFWRRAGLRYRPEFRWRGVGLGSVGKAAGWTFAMILVTQLAGIVQTNVASLAGNDDASLTVLRFSWLIFMLPHSIVTVSIGTAYFTRMSGHAHRGDFGALRADVSSSLRAIGIIMVFATAGLAVLAYPIAAVFAKHGFSETQAMGNVIVAYLLGLLPFSALFMLLRGFYALEDTRTPFFIQVFQALVFVAGALVVATLPTAQIAIGIAVVTSVAGYAQTVLAYLLLRRRLGAFGAGKVVGRYLGFVVAVLPAAAIGLLVDVALGAFRGGFAVSGVGAALLSIVLIGAVMLVLYVGILAALRSQELRELVRPLARRLRGRG